MFNYLIHKSFRLLIVAAVISVISGVCSVLVLTQINAALAADSLKGNSAIVWRFFTFIFIAMITQMVASILLERLGHSVFADLRHFIAERVSTSDFHMLEEVGHPPIQSALSEHTANVGGFFTELPLLLVNAVIVVGCIVYLTWLSWQIVLAAIVVIVLGATAYHLVHVKAIRHLDTAAKEQDKMFDHFHSLFNGAKELRLNVGKRLRFSEEILQQSIEKVKQERIFGMSIFIISAIWSNFLVYLFIGLVLFVLVGDVPERGKIMTGFTLIFLYMVGPLESLLMALPSANLAKVSAERIDEIMKKLEQHEQETSVSSSPELKTLQLQDVTHRYYHEEQDDMFTLGPINLSFTPGELTYLVGGNGCGKTTLAKLLVGLYKPEEGKILLNGEAIDDENRDTYRQIFSAIFSDFYLFERLLDAVSKDYDDKGNHLIAKLHLQHKVQIQEGAFTTRKLSQGQRKRLALVAAYLEERPFLVFDEWASDQDPLFKEVFYRELLPELKAMNKAVLVITHDNRYFHLADRLIRMENGQITAIESSPKEEFG